MITRQVTTAELYLYFKAMKHTRRAPDPFIVALGVNLVLGLVIAIIYSLVR